MTGPSQAMIGPAADDAQAAAGRQGPLLHVVAGAVTLLVLAPLVRPGYVLAYDMVFVPHQPLRWDLIAPLGGLPRAVPQDAVVSVLSLVAPGWLLQRAALVGAIYAAALGAGRLIPAERRLTRVAAAVGYAWSPFLAERLLIGHWGLLLAYGALPWLAAAAMSVRAGRPGALPRLILAAAVSAITPTGGVIAVATTLALTFGADRRLMARAGVAVGAVAVLNAPWVVASLLTAASGRSDPAGVAAFAARAENWSGPVAALAGTGGIWNAQTTPPSRASPLVPLVTAGVIVLACFGFGALRRRLPHGCADRMAVVAVCGLALAALGTLPLTADGLAWAVSHVPGAGLLRDGQKFVAPYALLLTLCAALGAERIAGHVAEPRARLVLASMIVLPVALMPDLAFGGNGRLRPVSYPADWDAVSAQIAAAPGEVLSLPFSEYRNYAWTGGATVIDPAPRYLPAAVLVDDRLRVGGIVIRGENPRAARVRELLAAGAPLSRTGVRWVLVQRDAGETVPLGCLDGLQLSYDGQLLDLYANPTAYSAKSTYLAQVRFIAVVNAISVGVLIVASLRLRRDATAW